MNYLECPFCKSDCQTMPAGPDDLWFDGDSGVCQCGRPVCVFVDGTEAFLCPDEDD